MMIINTFSPGLRFYRFAISRRWQAAAFVGAFIVFSAAALSAAAALQSSMVPKDQWISDIKTRETLANIYAQHPDTLEEAVIQYRILLETDPANPLYLLDLSEIYWQQNQFSQALSFFYQAVVPERNIKLQIKAALLEGRFGYYKECQNRFLQLLQNQSPPAETLMQAYADCMMFWGDFYRAKAIYAEQLQKHPGRPAVQQRYIDVLIGMQRFEEAEGLCYQSLEQFPRSPEIFLSRLVEIKRLQKDFISAIALAEQLTLKFPLKAQFEALKAQLLYDSARFEEALPLFLGLLEDPVHSAQASLGAGKCCLRLGQNEQAAEHLKIASQSPSTAIQAQFFLLELHGDLCADSILSTTETAQEMHVWSGLFAEIGCNTQRLQIDEAAVCADPRYYPAKVNLAEALSTQMRYREALQIYDSLLKDFPGDAKFLLDQARAVSWDKHYNRSICLYSHLIAIDPADPIPRVEQARVAFWGMEYQKSICMYQSLLESIGQLGSWAEEHWRERVLLERKIVELEWDKRPIHTLRLYEEMLLLRPGNPNWEYQYAQALCSLGLCGQAMEIYEDILLTDPLNTLVGMALERGRMRECPSYGFDYVYWKEIGYGTLDQIARYKAIVQIDYPLSCSEHIRFSQHNWIEHTFYDRRYHPAAGSRLEWEKRINCFLLTRAGVGQKAYYRNFEPTYTCFAECWFDLYDYGLLGVGFKKKDEIYNYFNLKQTTQAKVWWASLNSNITHSLSMQGLWEQVEFSDRNSEVHFLVGSEYAFTEYPKILKVSVSGEYRNTAHTNIYIYNSAGQLIDIIHPYWCPQKYYFGQAVIQWRQNYSSLQFCGAPNCYYDVKAAFGTDNQNNPFWELQSEWLHEFYYNWKFSVKAYVHRSPMWNAKGLWCSVNYQF